MHASSGHYPAAKGHLKVAGTGPLAAVFPSLHVHPKVYSSILSFVCLTMISRPTPAAMSLSSHHSRTKAVKDLLSRNCVDTKEYTQEERFAVSQLGLPPSLLHEAKALCAHYKDDSKREADHLLKASMWDAAHSVITNKLVSMAVINRKRLHCVMCWYACMRVCCGV